jgi:zinc protease
VTAPVERHVLDNGLTVLLRPTSHAPVTTFWAWYRVGSRNERSGCTGISHWVEHMLFKGSDRFPKGELDRLVAREGGVFNGLTWLDWTCYFETLPSDRIGLALEIESDRMTNALFDPEEVESERTVVISEREGHENSPLFLLAEEMQSVAIKVHPYHHEVIGWKGDLERMTRADLYDHYRRHYRPSNAIVAAVGAFETDRMLDQIMDSFGSLPGGESDDAIVTPEPEQRGERRVVVHGDDPTAFVAVAYRAPAAGDDDYFAYQILDTVLGGAKSMNLFGANPPNRSSRLYEALVASELATSVSSGLVATVDPFLYTITATVRTGADAGAVEERILAEVERIRADGLAPEELERAVKQSQAQFAYSSESVTDQGFWLGFAECIADQPWLSEYLNRLEAVSPDDVARVARRWLLPTTRTVGHFVPNGAVDK